DRSVKQNVFALKELIDPSEHDRSQLSFEGELLKRLAHPSLPRVYQVFENTRLKRLYLLMDYIEGKNLEAIRLQQPQQRFSLALALSLLAPIVDAINYLHYQELPVVHRDIKPANIIVPMKEGPAFLVDFGLAKEYSKDQTTTLIRYGSPGYAAPEQYGQGTSPRTDVYALGATLYTLLTGIVPVDALTRSVSNRDVDPLVPADKLYPDVSAPVAGVIDRAMMLDSAERFATVEEYWQKLKVAATQPAVKSPGVVLSALPTLTLSEKDIASITRKNAQRRAYADHVRRRKMLLPLILALMLITVTAASFSLYALRYQHSNPPIPQVTHTSTPHRAIPSVPAALYPPLSTTYAGTIFDIGVANEKTALYLSNIHQSQGNFSGKFQGLGKVGTFSGTVTKDGKLQFTVAIPGNGTISFQGNIKLAGDLTGEFYILNQSGQRTGEFGEWNVSALS
ncbi:MAG: serine/threonine protein kinase, partial [Chloroflexi bacterium]|nr:serine/threonine protein kinase [Chloroflexota bacterium]